MEGRIHRGDGWVCQFKGETWRCTVEPRLSPLSLIWVMRGPDFFDPLPAPDLAAFATGAATAINEAIKYAMQSPYITDIEAGGGLVISSAVVKSWEDYRLWFRLPKSHQMVGVQMVRGRPTDVYCDHP